MATLWSFYSSNQCGFSVELIGHLDLLYSSLTLFAAEYEVNAMYFFFKEAMPRIMLVLYWQLVFNSTIHWTRRSGGCSNAKQQQHAHIHSPTLFITLIMCKRVFH